MTKFTKSTKTLTLNTGDKIPQIALGTWLWDQYPDDGYASVLAALKAGYRHIDTAAYYRNEVAVGKAIKDSGIPREEIFVTSKLWGIQHRDPAKALDITLKKLGLDYINLFLVHWPIPLIANPSLTLEEDLAQADQQDYDWNFVKTWELVQELPATGKTRAVGVSNFSVKNLKELLAHPKTKVVPATVQVETHPLLPQHELLKFAKENGIVLEAFSPLGSSDSPYWKNKTLNELAAKYDASVAQLLINWGVKRGYVVLPKSANPDRLVKNLQVFELADEDSDKITDLYNTEGELRIHTQDWGTFPLFE